MSLKSQELFDRQPEGEQLVCGYTCDCGTETVSTSCLLRFKIEVKVS